MDSEKIRSFALGILAELPPPPPLVYTSADALDAAIAAATPGSTLLLSTSLVYPKPLVLTKSLTLQSETWADRRNFPMTADEPAPKFLAGLTATSDAHNLLGLDVRHTSPTATIAVMGGSGCTWDRMRILGDPKLGAKRGIDFRGGLSSITHAYIDDIFQPAQDTQAIYSQEMLPGGGLLIADSFLRAAGQSLMLGGGDPSNAAGIPSNVKLLRSLLTKRSEWLTFVSPAKHAQQVKCSLELKNVIGFTSQGCTFEYAGVSAGQGAYLFVLTPRNQNNTAPYSTVQDVLIEDFTASFASGVANLLGSDNLNPSGPLKNVTFLNGVITNIDHLLLPGSTGRLFMFDRAAQDVTLSSLNISGLNVAAGLYLTGAPPTNLVLKALTMPPSKYGNKIDGSTGKGGSGRKALLAYMPDASLDASIL